MTCARSSASGTSSITGDALSIRIWVVAVIALTDTGIVLLHERGIGADQTAGGACSDAGSAAGIAVDASPRGGVGVGTSRT